jgi:hypothetical protein
MQLISLNQFLPSHNSFLSLELISAEMLVNAKGFFILHLLLHITFLLNGLVLKAALLPTESPPRPQARILLSSNRSSALFSLLDVCAKGDRQSYSLECALNCAQPLLCEWHRVLMLQMAESCKKKSGS